MVLYISVMKILFICRRKSQVHIRGGVCPAVNRYRVHFAMISYIFVSTHVSGNSYYIHGWSSPFIPETYVTLIELSCKHQDPRSSLKGYLFLVNIR